MASSDEKSIAVGPISGFQIDPNWSSVSDRAGKAPPFRGCLLYTSAQDGHAAGPEEFVDQQGHTLDGDGSQQLAGDVHGTVSAYDKGVSRCV